jgi:hypothetical protein
MWRGRALFRKSAPPVDLVVLRHSGHRLATTLGTSSSTTAVLPTSRLPDQDNRAGLTDPPSDALGVFDVVLIWNRRCASSLAPAGLP